MAICITATGLYTPPHRISNEELVAVFNQYVDRYNAEHADAIAAGEVTALQHSSAEFIEKVSGIKSRYVVDKSGILDPEVMAPKIPARKLGEELSVMAEMGVAALQQALQAAGLTGQDLDAVIVASSNFQRAYPAIAIEIQQAIGMTGGFGFDMNVACSAATFGIAQAVGLIETGLAKRVAVLNIEITSAHLNWRNRDSHFIFGDVAMATLIEQTVTPHGYEVLGSKLFTEFSTNVKNEFGFLDRSENLAAGRAADDYNAPVHDKLFLQEGRKVFREVCPAVSNLILAQLAEHHIDTTRVKKLWLHQANANMVDLILRTVLGKDADKSIAPLVIDEFANTSSASPMIVFHRHQEGMTAGDIGVICSFGAGYSIGSILVKKCAQ
ncbi:beta-ketoacyl-ACP synthase III [Faucicola atlantae]|uniref:beta-ketoacyl-ACP synthase III n=1 Tax=Faucicola atlantae TaxID=34059 RepID=UPI0025AEF531|nr:beta-ketoacyl-ACP synthase III [Moraxella atlantae]